MHFKFLAAAILGIACSTPTLAQDALHRNDTKYQLAMAKAVRNAANQVLPSVVAIELIGTGGGASGEIEQDAPTSGVVVDDSGFVLASSIVVRRPSASILVVLADGSRHTAKVVARDHHRDLVLLKINAKKPLVAVALPKELDLAVGQTTIAVGRYGSNIDPMVSRGVLSAVERLDGIALQTDARVAPSFYGGPLIDLRGNVLGILIPAVGQGGAEDPTGWYDSGIAFAIPADVIAKKIARLKSGEDIKKGLIGFVSKTKDPYKEGTQIAAVRSRSPAEFSKIKAGDHVLEVEGIRVRRQQEIRQVLGRFDAGEEVRLKLRRDSKEIEAVVTLADSIPPLQPQRLGIIASEQTTESSGNEEKQEGNEKDEAEEVTEVVVDAILPNSPVDGKLEPGDVITKIANAEIADTESLRRQMMSAQPAEELKIELRRGGEAKEVKITPKSIAGGVTTAFPDAWKADSDDEKWTTQEIKLPDAGNAAAYVAPKPDSTTGRLGLLVLLLSPGQEAPEDILKDWPRLAKKWGVVVCAIAPENTRRWQPKEMEVVANFAAAVLKKAPIDQAAVAIAAAGALHGGEATAADSMALAVAISNSNTFFGVGVSDESRPPAVRLRENEPSSSLQVMFPIKTKDDLPTWSVTLAKTGYPIVLGGDTDGDILLRWVRLLQSI